jgi:hypothetical protein
MRLRRNGGGEVQTSPHRIGLGKGSVLKKVEQYRQYAAECRDMARTAPFDHRKQLQQMAETWEQLAQECRKRDDANNDRKGLVIEFVTPRPKGRS